MLMWDSGVRISEITSLNIGHVQFDRYGAVIIVTRKTGRRRLRLISSVPDLQQWMNLHPERSNANAPLFITLRNYGKSPRRMDMHIIENTLKSLTKKSLYDRKKYKIIISVSSSYLLDSQLSTLLSGRFFTIPVFPLDFRDYLAFQGIEITDDPVDLAARKYEIVGTRARTVQSD